MLMSARFEVLEEGMVERQDIGAGAFFTTLCFSCHLISRPDTPIDVGWDPRSPNSSVKQPPSPSRPRLPHPPLHHPPATGQHRV